MAEHELCEIEPEMCPVRRDVTGVVFRKAPVTTSPPFANYLYRRPLACFISWSDSTTKYESISNKRLID